MCCFKTLYKGEDAADKVWRERPQWLRPVAGGFLLGPLLLALPQMYGVGYPVVDRVFAGDYVVWFVLILLAGKILASSLTLWIGGSGGVFAPSLFIGAATGTAFGVTVHDLFGAAIGPAALYGVVGMGAVFAGAAQAPLTAIASVAEMTGNFTLTLPIMLACGLASQLARQITHGSIYTTKLLRRGIDIERPRPASMWQTLTVADVMQPVAKAGGEPLVGDRAEGAAQGLAGGAEAVAGAHRHRDRHPPTSGAARRRDAGASAPPADPLRAGRPARAFRRSPAAERLDNAPPDTACAVQERERLGSRR